MMMPLAGYALSLYTYQTLQYAYLNSWDPESSKSGFGTFQNVGILQKIDHGSIGLSTGLFYADISPVENQDIYKIETLEGDVQILGYYQFSVLPILLGVSVLGAFGTDTSFTTNGKNLSFAFYYGLHLSNTSYSPWQPGVFWVNSLNLNRKSLSQIGIELLYSWEIPIESSCKDCTEPKLDIKYLDE